MLSRKELKKRARVVVRSHYWILLLVCLIAAVIGTEFDDSLDFAKQLDPKATEEEIIEATNNVPISDTIGSSKLTMVTALTAALSGNEKEAKEISQQITQNAVTNSEDGKTSPVLGRSRGVLASVINEVSSGELFIPVIAAIRHMGAAADVVFFLCMGLVLLALFFLWFFFIDLYEALSRRFFLESRTYKEIPVRRFLFFLRVKKWRKAAMAMFMRMLFLFLWAFTIVGAIIKSYSYTMVPYIVAENPDIGWKKAIKLSRKMMDGHKWECFILEMSFIPWYILSMLTLGISGVLYSNAYQIATMTEYYAQLRQIAKDNKIEYSELLNDEYLYEKADVATLENAYADVVALSNEPEKEMKRTGFKGFLANVFGITIFRQADEAKYEANEERKLRITAMEGIINGESYPGRLFTIKEKEKDRKVGQLHYLRHYTIPSLIMLFFIFSIIGWMWEVSLHLISDGRFVNRGVLHGPWLPIYGSGGVMILTLLNKFRKNPAVEAITTVVLCGCVEYFSSYYLQVTHNGKKWWDYSGYFLNINGRVSAEGLLVFGLGGMAIVYVVAPLLDNYIRLIRYRYLVPVCAAFLIVFGADQIYSSKHPNMGEGITDYTSSIDPPIKQIEIG